MGCRFEIVGSLRLAALLCVRDVGLEFRLALAFNCIQPRPPCLCMPFSKADTHVYPAVIVSCSRRNGSTHNYRSARQSSPPTSHVRFFSVSCLLARCPHIGNSSLEPNTTRSAHWFHVRSLYFTFFSLLSPCFAFFFAFFHPKGTFNVNGRRAWDEVLNAPLDLSAWLQSETAEEPPDLYVLGYAGWVAGIRPKSKALVSII